MRSSRILAIAAALGAASFTAEASATTYEVGPGQPFGSIHDTLESLAPGDVVEVQGGATYPGDLWIRTGGEPGNPIIFRGVAVNGQRPVLEGVGSEEYHDMIVLLYANHVVFEGFEIVGDGNPDHSGIVSKADDVTIRDVLVHGVGGQGLLGTDSESGSLLLESSEFHSNGEGTYNHQIYMATDESMYPGSVFRMQYCYVHDGAGGNNVKSRSERNEIYFNWIEGAVFHELDLIGPDGQDEGLAREDSDVVGNVFIKHSEWFVARIGGDGTGNTSGRYRFANNTMVLGDLSERVITMQETVASLELFNNVVVRQGGAGGVVVGETDTFGPPPTVSGSNNWVQDGFEVRPEIGATFGADPLFADGGGLDFRPAEGSPLVDGGTAAPASPDFPAPRGVPDYVPPSRLLGTHGTRPADAALDIGAFELGSGTEPGEPVATVGTGAASGGGSGEPSGSGGADGSSGGPAGDGSASAGGGDAASDGSDDGCACRAAGAPPGSPRAAYALIAAGLAAFARQRKSRASSRLR